MNGGMGARHRGLFDLIIADAEVAEGEGLERTCMKYPG